MCHKSNRNCKWSLKIGIMNVTRERTMTVGNVKVKDPKLLKEIIDKMLFPDVIILHEILLQNQFFASKVKDVKGRNILYYAFLHSLPDEGICKMMETFPTLIGQCDDYGGYPLHWAISLRCNDNLVLKILEMFPSAITKRHREWLPALHALHLAIIYKASDSVILRMIELCPDQSELLKANDVSLFNMATSQKCSEAVILKLLDSVPGIVTIPHVYSRFGYCALQRAIFSNQSETVTLKIIQLFPEASEILFRNGPTALHCALLANSSEKVILKLLEVFPKALEMPYISDRYPDLVPYPLHAAIRFNKSEHVILTMIQMFPNAIESFIKRNTVTSSAGQFALHEAIRYYSSSETVFYKLIEAFPNALKVAGNNGIYPLPMILSGSKCSEPIMLQILELRTVQVVIQDMDERSQRNLMYSAKCNCRSKAVVSKLQEIVSKNKMNQNKRLKIMK